MKKINCWEFNSCGRELGGVNKDKYGLCQVSILSALDGINNGVNGGRQCWGLANNLGCCIEKCIIADNYSECPECPFYQLVENEEGENFIS